MTNTQTLPTAAKKWRLIDECPKNRVIYLDLLRIVSAFAVILTHVSAQYWYDLPTHSFSWNVMNVYDSISRYGVSVFMMISGALFLNPDKKFSVKKLYTKNIVRIVVAFLFWSAVYILFHYHTYPQPVQGIDLLHTWMSGHYHMWFMFMLLGVYIITPIARAIVANPKAGWYFLGAALFFSFVTPLIVDHNDYLRGLYYTMDFHMTLGISCYYIAGGMIHHYGIPKLARRIIYILGVVGFVGTAVITAVVSMKKYAPQEQYYGHFTFFVMFEALSIFTFFQYGVEKIKFSDKVRNLIYHISNRTFGIYMVHILILDNLIKDTFKLTTLSFSPLFSVPVIALLVYLISYLVITLVRRIPVVHKFIS